MIKAIIYDMDGILIDSEPLWKIAEKKTFKKVGIDLTTDMCNLTMGFRTDEVVQYWHQRQPWSNLSLKTVEEDMINNVAELVTQEGKLMEGVVESLQFFKAKGLKIGLASSSVMRLIQHVIKTLDIAKYFEIVHSAELEQYGKPHPAVYIGAVNMLGENPLNCLAIEDSFNGLIAAKAAKMHTIAVPDPSYGSLEKFIIADMRLKSLAEINESVWQNVTKSR